ncbi:hypothetical protein CWE13_04900 [Aliidiomarina shirensis]|uniref:Glycosyltransferase RgtA/B/C/D-like domain-containing protein n=1 Tax=Aliidiomarina shirensis TaxID=1048642 RepID=A0A432WU66_9GAMM|nr:hypothetical protein [Aliidiomarina shirensis]RUO37305.1 hypothetical protein CWE13_04900 [Aliidiomarina shirensis]
MSFVSDELGYINSEDFNLLGDARGLWHSLNYLIINYDFAGYYSLRFINIIFASFVLIYIARIFDDGKLSIFLLASCPFIFAMTYVNLRDLAIIFSALLVFDGLRRKSILGIALGLVALLTLRPLIAFVLLISLAVFYLIDTKSHKTYSGAFALLMLGLLSLIILYFGIDYFQSYLRYMEYLSVTDNQHRSILAQEDSSPMRALLTYVFTPLPTSLFQRLLGSGASELGLAHDLIRILHQSLYFIMMFVMLLNPKQTYNGIIRLFTSLGKEQKALILFLLAHAVVYSIHLAGIGHSRLKLPFQMAIGIVFYLIYIKNRFVKIR